MARKTTYELVERPPLPSGRYLVLGLGRSGRAATKLLCARGREVVAVDSGSPAGSDTLGDFGATTVLESDGVELVPGVDVVVKSPGVPQEAPAVVAARAAGKLVIGELELAWRLTEHPVIAVTGTNGKTTTTELLGQIHRDAGLPVAVAGNVGTALSELVDSLEAGATIVLEASSFQIEDAPSFTPECGILLNLAPDHIDRHGSYERYVAAKLGLFAGQQEGQFAVTGPSVDVEIPGRGRHYRVPRPDLDRIGDAIAMSGAHNKENALIATQAALLMGVDPQSVSRTIATFTGLPHRMELIASVGGVSFVNDSKATNVAATLAALGSYEGGVHLILGGSDKGEDYAPLAGAVARACAGVHLGGANADELAAVLARSGVPVSRHERLEEAFASATSAATPGQTVLLSPACASFDQFTSYEARGQRFRELVEAL